MPSSTGSITGLLRALEQGSQRDAAAQELWTRFQLELTRDALRRLRAMGASRTVSDEDDVAAKAFDSICRRIEHGCLKLNSRLDFRKMLLRATKRAVQNQAKREKTLKRGGTKVIVSGSDAGHEAGGTRASESGSEPVEIASALEECRRMLDKLGDETQRKIVLWRLIGCTNKEIADRLGPCVATIENKLKLIRKRWSEDFPCLTVKPGRRSAHHEGAADVTGPPVGGSCRPFRRPGPARSRGHGRRPG